MPAQRLPLRLLFSLIALTLSLPRPAGAQGTLADYLRAGIPVSVLVGIISLTLIPLFWHFCGAARASL